MYEDTEKGTLISDYKGVKRYVKYAGSQHLNGLYLKAFYDVFHFDIENGQEIQSLDFPNKRVQLTATNDVAIDLQGNFIAQNENGFFIDSNNQIILNENNEPASIGEAGIIGQLTFLENLNFSMLNVAKMEIQRADENKRFDKPINEIDIVRL